MKVRASTSKGYGSRELLLMHKVQHEVPDEEDSSLGFRFYGLGFRV